MRVLPQVLCRDLTPLEDSGQLCVGYWRGGSRISKRRFVYFSVVGLVFHLSVLLLVYCSSVILVVVVDDDGVVKDQDGDGDGGEQRFGNRTKGMDRMEGSFPYSVVSTHCSFNTTMVRMSVCSCLER